MDFTWGAGIKTSKPEGKTGTTDQHHVLPTALDGGGPPHKEKHDKQVHPPGALPSSHYSSWRGQIRRPGSGMWGLWSLEKHVGVRRNGQDKQHTCHTLPPSAGQGRQGPPPSRRAALGTSVLRMSYSFALGALAQDATSPLRAAKRKRVGSSPRRATERRGSVHTWCRPLDWCVTAPTRIVSLRGRAMNGGHRVVKAGATLTTPLVDKSLSESLRKSAWRMTRKNQRTELSPGWRPPGTCPQGLCPQHEDPKETPRVTRMLLLGEDTPKSNLFRDSPQCSGPHDTSSYGKQRENQRTKTRDCEDGPWSCVWSTLMGRWPEGWTQAGEEARLGPITTRHPQNPLPLPFPSTILRAKDIFLC